MTKEEIEWYEENWYKFHTRINVKRSKATDSRSYKLAIDIWDMGHDGCHNPKYYNDSCCWKSNRKTQYRPPKIKKEKVRKSSHKEHWRYKKSCHTTKYLNIEWRRFVEKKREARRKEAERQKANIEELKATGKWIYEV